MFYNGLFSSLFRAFCTVFGTTLATAVNSGCIEGTADDVITHAWEVLNTTATDHNDGVFLKVVAFAGDVGVDLFLVGEADTGNLTHSRIRFFRGGCVNAGADTTTLRAGI